MKKIIILFFLFLSSIGFSQTLEDSRGRSVREEKGREISRYVHQKFEAARSEKDPYKAWKIYVEIQKEVPEELVKVSSRGEASSGRAEGSSPDKVWQAARVVAWREMKGLLEKGLKEEEALSDFIDVKCKKLYEEALSDSGLNAYEAYELTRLMYPYLPLNVGAYWYEKMADHFIERGDFLRAYSYLKDIKEYSMGWDKKLQTKLNYIEEKTVILGKQSVTWDAVYQITSKKSGLWDMDYFLELSFFEKKLHKKLYDIETISDGQKLIQDQDKIILHPGMKVKNFSYLI